MTVKVFKLFCDFKKPSCKLCEQEEQQEKENHKAEQLERVALENRIKKSGIPPRFGNKSFADYKPCNKNAEKILGICHDYAENFPEKLLHGTSLILSGHAGTGKSHLACAIANKVIHQHKKSAVFTQVAKAIRMVKETYAKGSNRTEQEALNVFKIPDLLILDEVGVQFGTDTEKYILFEIVNERYEQMKPTIFLSNLALAGLVEYAGERTIDRMKENGGRILIFDWESHRAAQN